jgi:tape measure domain-containing protein
MADNAQFTTRIVVSGAVDPSLAKSLGISQQAMLKLNQLTTQLGASNKVVAKSYMTFGPELQKASIQADRLSGSMRRVGEIVAGIGIADAIVGGLRTAVNLAGQLGDKFHQFASEASKLSSQRELMVKGLGNILGNQAQAGLVYESMFNIAKSSPYQAKDLIDPVKRFVASGMSLNQLQWLATRQGDLMAGIGGGQDEMGRATLAFQEINAKGYANSRQLNTQLGSLGIPVQKTLENILHVNPEQLDKMIKKHQITTDVVMKMVEVLTGPGGMFFESMKKFATTFQGLETTIVDEFQRFQSDFGDVVNDLTKIVYGWVGGSDVWNKVNTYMDELKQLNHGVLSFISSMPSSEILGKFQPYFQNLQNTFTGFNQWLGSFFNLVEIPNQGNEYVLNATGEAKVKEYLDDVVSIMEKTAKVMTVIVNIGARTGDALNAMGKLWNLYEKFDQFVWRIQNTLSGHSDVPGTNRIDPNNPANRGFNYQSQFGGPHMASGGVLVGEAGVEAVLPMSNSSLLDDLNSTLQQLNSFLTNAFPAGTPGGALGSVGAGFGGVRGGGGGGSWLANTQYGPGVDYVDANGRVHGTPDSDSSRGIGHIHGVAYKLGAGSVALHSEYAEGVLHIKPGQWFRNPRTGRLQQWNDTSGARNPQNIDEFVPGNGTTVHVHINAIDSKSFEGTVKQHAKVIQKHLDQESSKSAKINSKGGRTPDVGQSKL